MVQTNDRLQPLEDPLIGHGATVEFCQRCREIRKQTLKYRLIQRLLILEMVVQAGGANTYPVSNITQRSCAIAFFGKDVFRRI